MRSSNNSWNKYEIFKSEYVWQKIYDCLAAADVRTYIHKQKARVIYDYIPKIADQFSMNEFEEIDILKVWEILQFWL